MKCVCCCGDIPGQDIDPSADYEFKMIVPDWQWGKLYYLLGRFSNSYAKLETDLAIHVQNFIEELTGFHNIYQEGSEHLEPLVAMNLNRQKMAGRSIKSSETIKFITERLSISGYRNTLLKLASISEMDRDLFEFLKKLLAQVEVLGRFRNRLMHNGAYPDMRDKGEWFYTTDHHVRAGNIKLLYFELSTLENASKDIERVIRMMSNFYTEGRGVEGLADLEAHAWNYNGSLLLENRKVEHL